MFSDSHMTLNMLKQKGQPNPVPCHVIAVYEIPVIANVILMK